MESKLKGAQTVPLQYIRTTFILSHPDDFALRPARNWRATVRLDVRQDPKVLQVLRIVIWGILVHEVKAFDKLVIGSACCRLGTLEFLLTKSPPNDMMSRKTAEESMDVDPCGKDVVGCSLGGRAE